jgi:hypothetical protein
MDTATTVESPLTAEDKHNVVVVYRPDPESSIIVDFWVHGNEETVYMMRQYSGMPIDLKTASDTNLMAKIDELEDLTRLRFIPCAFPCADYMVFVRADVLEEMGAIAPVNHAMPA